MSKEDWGRAIEELLLQAAPTFWRDEAAGRLLERAIEARVVGSEALIQIIREDLDYYEEGFRRLAEAIRQVQEEEA